jgi:hypothetical protein
MAPGTSPAITLGSAAPIPAATITAGAARTSFNLRHGDAAPPRLGQQADPCGDAQRRQR